MIAAIYARKSTDQVNVADDHKSIPRQIDSARAFAAARGWTIDERYVYADTAMSGAETRKLLHRQRLLAAIALDPPPFQVLIMRDDSRFSRRDGDEAFGELKRVAQQGVAVWFYQDGTRFEYGNFAANITGIVRAEMNAEYRRQIARWTHDAMLRKAKAGHVTGGKCFGYDNVDVFDATGKKSHVVRRINPSEADVVRRIFQLRAEGVGQSRIAKQLNAERATAPRSQQGRPRAWGPSSVHEVLYRELYRGVITWNKSRKRDTLGQHKQTDRPAGDWLQIPAPDLRIVSEPVWKAAHQLLERARRQYEKDTHGKRRKHRDEDSKYLLPSFGRCAVCGGGMHVRSRSHGAKRAFFYACTSHYTRGPEVCPHVEQWPMEALDRTLLAAIGARLATATEELITEARHLFRSSAPAVDVEARRRRDLAELERVQARLTEAIAAGGDLPILITRLRETEHQRLELSAQTAAPRRPQASWREIERRMRERLADFTTLLTDGTIAQARQFLRLLPAPILFTPCVDAGYRAIRMEGRLGLEAMFGSDVVMNLASPTGTEIHYQPVFHEILRSNRRAA